MAPRKKTFALSIFLSKKNTPRTECVNKDKIKKFSATKILLKPPLNGEIYFYNSESEEPDWIRYLDPHTSGTHSLRKLLEPGFSNSALVVIDFPIISRCLMLAFGYGKSLLKYENLEMFFGRNVILNSIEIDNVLSVKSRSYDQQPRHKENQGTTSANLNEFELDLENEILQKMTGEYPEAFFEDAGLGKKSIGRKMTGYDSINLSTSITLDKLEGLATWLSQCFESNEYKELLPDIDSFCPVKSEDLVADLNQKLVKMIQKKDVERLHISVPYILDTEEYQEFSLLGLGRKTCESLRADLLCMSDICDSLEEADELDSLDLDCLKNKYHLVCYSKMNSLRNKKPNLLRCITGEVKIRQTTYALMDGDWFRIEKLFFDRILKYLDKRVSENFVGLSSYKPEDGDEYVYNHRQSKEFGHHLFDQDLVPLRGKGRIEVCDLLGPTGELIHIKKYSASSTLSHLFSQGYVSIKSLMEDETFRKTFLDKLSNRSVKNKIKKKLERRDASIVFGILMKQSKHHKPDNKIKNLPAFSIVNLHKFARDIETLGFDVKIQFVFH